jgi:tetratricopeptide (TPR) repeat protein
MSSLHQRAKDLFLQALSQPDADRNAFLETACGEDVDLRHEVESLLAFHQEEEDITPGPGPETAQARFAPGDVFAGRYRMITRLGRGGMGEVWRADDVVLEAPVALKLISSAEADARDRVLNEVRLARQITHPSVCRVFDVGEAAGDVFFSMELVEGEDLASLLRRVGRLPSERVIDIARQLCAGLAAAHAQGVLHRDLKPANVLIDDNGAVRITDFGIATTKSRTDRKVLVGTPGYMAPEQMVPGGRLSERTDVYALGTVLYELVVGQHPFSRSGTGTQPPRPSTLAPHVDPNLERVIMRALAADPQDRPASANAVAEALPTRSLLDGRKTRRWFIGAAAAGIAIAAIAGSFFLSRGAPVLTEQDVIVLADFMNTTGEPVFDGTLKVALAVALEQSPFLKVFPDERVHETLRFMKRSLTEGVTRGVAREIAQRERLKALIAGSIGRLGRNYVLALEAVNAETGDVMARQQVEVADKEQVLTALGQAASKLREKLGESLASIQRFDVPLPRATTASLDALAAYSLALDDGRITPRLEAIPHLKRAIEIDPNFALALALLSGVYANTDQTALAPEFSRKAFEQRDRVSERERFFISWRYYRDATQAWDKALELAQSWVETYPREAFAFNSLGNALLFFGRYDQAIEPFKHALQLDPKFAPLYSNLASAYMALNRFDEAKAILQEGVSRQLDFNGFHRIAYLLAFIDGDSASMARHLDASIGVGRTNAAYGWQAHASAFGGRLSAAHEQFRRGIELALQGGFREVAAQLSIEDAETHAIVGQCPQALKEVPDGLALSRDNFSLERASRALALCGADGQVAAIKSELTRRFPEATLTLRVSLPTSEALLATSHDEWARALKLLEPVRVYENTPWAEFWAPYLRGQAHLHLHDGPHAAEEFQSILNHRGQAPVAQLYSLAYLGLARAQAMSGANDRSSEAYDRFLTLWSEADANLGVLTAARQEQSRLRANLHE